MIIPRSNVFDFKGLAVCVRTLFFDIAPMQRALLSDQLRMLYMCFALHAPQPSPFQQYYMLNIAWPENESCSCFQVDE